MTRNLMRNKQQIGLGADENKVLVYDEKKGKLNRFRRANIANFRILKNKPSKICIKTDHNQMHKYVSCKEKNKIQLGECIRK